MVCQISRFSKVGSRLFGGSRPGKRNGEKNRHRSNFEIKAQVAVHDQALLKQDLRSLVVILVEMDQAKTGQVPCFALAVSCFAVDFQRSFVVCGGLIEGSLFASEYPKMPKHEGDRPWFPGRFEKRKSRCEMVSRIVQTIPYAVK